MEFHLGPGGQMQFLGYSVFRTATHGAYGGNLVANQRELLGATGADPLLLADLVHYHLSHLPSLLGDYQGPLGIDMMRLSDGHVHPVVEINLRRTMGHLALTLYERGITGNESLTPPPADDAGFQAVVSGGLLQILPPRRHPKAG